jgi:molecular chaperone GrpE
MTKDPKKNLKKETVDEEISQAPPETETVRQEVTPEETDWKVKSDEYLNDLRRTQADFENYKKRMVNEQKDAMRFITTGIISDLVPILDNFNVAVAHVPEDKKSDPWVTGITYIEKQFEEVLAGFGVSIMDVKAGDDFDPTRHEAVSTEETSDNNRETNDAEAHKIAKVLQKGYLMGDKVIRAAKVTVS